MTQSQAAHYESANNLKVASNSMETGGIELQQINSKVAAAKQTTVKEDQKLKKAQGLFAGIGETGRRDSDDDTKKEKKKDKKDKKKDKREKDEETKVPEVTAK